MRKLELFDGTKTYMAPSGALFTPERMRQEYPALSAFAHVIETDENGEVCFAIENLSALRGMHNIDRSLSNEEAVAALEEIINAEPEIVEDDEPTPEERIAAALEFQNLMSLEDIEA